MSASYPEYINLTTPHKCTIQQDVIGASNHSYTAVVIVVCSKLVC